MSNKNGDEISEESYKETSEEEIVNLNPKLRRVTFRDEKEKTPNPYNLSTGTQERGKTNEDFESANNPQISAPYADDSYSIESTGSSTTSTESEEEEKPREKQIKFVRFKDLDDEKKAVPEEVQIPLDSTDDKDDEIIKDLDDQFKEQIHKILEQRLISKGSPVPTHVIEMSSKQNEFTIEEFISSSEDDEPETPAVEKRVRWKDEMPVIIPMNTIDERQMKKKIREETGNTADDGKQVKFTESLISKESAQISRFNMFLEDITTPDEKNLNKDFTHGNQEKKRYIIPRLTPHETQRLKGNKFLHDASKVNNVSGRKDYLVVSLAFLTVNCKIYLKEAFDGIAQDQKGIGKIYSARMISKFHEYSSLFKSTAGSEGMVASMRFTSHCNDIIKTYIQLLHHIEDPDKFGEIITDLAKRHEKLKLKLKDHQKHYKPFIDIIGAKSDEPMKLYSGIVFFVVLVSRAMLKIESELREKMNEKDDIKGKRKNYTKRTTINITQQQRRESQKQPVWD